METVDAELRKEIEEMYARAVGGVTEFLKRNVADEQPTDHLRHSKVVTTALANVAAQLAVDSGMDLLMFMQVCHLNYQEAVARAPRWH
jgi:hypothetical protein